MQHFHSQTGRHECILTLPPYRSADIPVRSNVLPANGQQNAAELSFVNCCGQECPRSGGSVKMHPRAEPPFSSQDRLQLSETFARVLRGLPA